MFETSPLIIKICGITRLEDGLAAVDVGADWLGFIRWPKSKRFRPAGECAGLAAELRREAARPFEAVGVYVDASREVIESEAREIGLDRIQLHGDESPEFARSLEQPVIKAIAIRDGESLARADDYGGLDLMVDAHDPDLRGGTGRSYDYSMLAELVRSRRVIIAGGLDVDSVGGVVRALRPWGVDVSSGVETSPGIKHSELVRAFIRNARMAVKDEDEQR